MKGTDHVFACCAVNRSFAANAAVDLRKQSCWYLDKSAAAFDDMCRKTRDVADHAATKCDNMVAAFHMLFKQPIGQALQLFPAFTRFACRKCENSRINSHRRQCGVQYRQHGMGDIFIGDYEQAIVAGKGHQMRPCIRQQTCTHMDVIRCVGKVDGNHGHAASAFRIFSTVRACGDVSLRMWKFAAA